MGYSNVKPYVLGKQTFSTKSAIKTYFQDFYRDHSVGTLLPREQRRVMRDLITWHPNYDEWNVDRRVKFKIGKDDYGSKNFLVRNTEKEWEVFSYNKCIAAQSKEKNQRKTVIQAARWAIKEQINEFRKNNLICIKCGSSTKIEIDHNFETLTFQTMLDTFLEVKQKKYSDFQLISRSSGHQFNEEDWEAWEAYHRDNCQLRSLCWSCHHRPD